MSNTTTTAVASEEVYDAAGNAFITLTEAARRTGVTREAIRHAVIRGALTMKRFGPYVFVSVESVERYQPNQALVGRRVRRRRKPSG